MALVMEDKMPSAGIKVSENKPDTPDLSEKRRKFRAYETNKEKEITEQRLADRYYHTKQWSDKEIETLKRRGQPTITSNRVKRKIDFLVGVEQRMRRDPKAYGRNPQDTQTADTITAALRFVADHNRWDSKASHGTNEGMRRGVGVVFVGIKQGRSSLEVEIKDVDGERFFYDPRSTKHDFSDARYMGVTLWLDIDEAKDEWPDADFERYMEKDGGLSTFAVEQDRDTQWGDFEHRRVRVVEMWERKATGWTYCKFCGDLYLEGGNSPYVTPDGDTDCPYEAWSPYIDETGIRYGLVRDMQSIQDEINQRRSKALHEINNRQMFITQGSVDDVDELRRQIAKADGIIEVPGGSEWGKDFGPIDRTKEIRGNLDMLVEAKQEIENIGPNPGLVGQGSGVEAASGRALSMQRDSGMTELQPVFDHNRDWKLRVYRKMWSRIKQSWTGERWVRITDNPDAPKFVGINQYEMDEAGQIKGNNLIGEVDVDVILDEGPDTMTVQEELFQTLSQLGEAALGPLGQALIELSNVANKERILELLSGSAQQNPEQQQAQEQERQQVMRGNEAKVQAEEAKAENLRANTAKTMSEIQMSGAKMPSDIEHKQAQTFKTIQDAQHQDAKLPADIAHLDAQTRKTMVDALMAQQSPQEWQQL